MAMIIAFSTPSDPRSVVSRRETDAEVIVFPRTDIRALRRLSETATDAPPGGDHPATSGDDGPA